MLDGILKKKNDQLNPPRNANQSKKAEFSLESSRRKARRSLRLEVKTPCQPPHQPIEHEAYQSKSKVNPTTQTYASQHWITESVGEFSSQTLTSTGETKGGKRRSLWRTVSS